MQITRKRFPSFLTMPDGLLTLGQYRYRLLSTSVVSGRYFTVRYVVCSKVVKFIIVLVLIPIMVFVLGCNRNRVDQDNKKQRNQNQQKSQNEKGDKGGGTKMVILKTSKGNIKFELYKDESPVTVDNFLAYVEDGFYDGTIFHRVINNFMIQGGGMTSDMRQKPTREPIKNEANNGLKNERGTIAMARTGVVDSATSQFFINHADNGFLDHGTRDYGYAVFGRVVEGMEVVDEIARVSTGSGDVPRETITIESATAIQPPE